jgi:hypothetical protein
MVPAGGLVLSGAAVASAADGLNMMRVDDRPMEGLGVLKCRPKGVDEGLKIDFERSSPAD